MISKKTQIDLSSETKLQTFSEHIKDLRICVARCFGFVLLGLILMFFLLDSTLSFFFYPLQKLGQMKICFFAPQDAFLLRVQLLVIGALCLSMPFILITIWQFFAPAVYYKKRYPYALLLTILTILFFCGIIFSYIVVFPIVLKFFLSFEHPFCEFILSAQKYFRFLLKFMLAFGVMFTLPFFLFLLHYFGFISIKSLRTKRKVVLIGILIISSFLTPPDVLSQIFLTVPIYFLYECSILAICLFSKKENSNHSYDNS